MSNFNKNREINLHQYVPDVLSEVDEFETITTLETDLKKKQWDSLEKIFDSQYILQASEFGISMFEKMHDIHPLATDSLEYRRSRIYQLYNTESPFTRRWFDGALRGMLKDAISYYYKIDTENLSVAVFIEGLSPIRRKQFNDWLDNVIPYNMGLESWKITPIDLNIRCGGYVSMGGAMTIKPRVAFEDTTLNKNYCYGGVVRLHTVYDLKVR